MEKSALDWIALILVFIGSINWALVGLADLNLVTMIFGTIPMLVTLVYVLVGLSGIYVLWMATKG